MKYALITASFVLLFIPNLFAQSILLKDDFDKNDGSWLTLNNASSLFKIENGVYSLQDKDTTQRWYTWRDIDYFSHQLDFEIETKIKLKVGSSKGSYGIAWGLADLKNLNTFNISCEGSFYVETKVNNVYKNEVPKTKSKYINGLGYYNTLKIKAKGQKIYYYINDSLVHRVEKPEIKGANLGFMVDKNSTIEVDYVLIRQDAKINLVENSIRGRKSRPLDKINTTAYENSPMIRI